MSDFNQLEDFQVFDSRHLGAYFGGAYRTSAAESAEMLGNCLQKHSERLALVSTEQRACQNCCWVSQLQKLQLQQGDVNLEMAGCSLNTPELLPITSVRLRQNLTLFPPDRFHMRCYVGAWAPGPRKTSPTPTCPRTRLLHPLAHSQGCV